MKLIVKFKQIYFMIKRDLNKMKDNEVIHFFGRHLVSPVSDIKLISPDEEGGNLKPR